MGFYYCDGRYQLTVSVDHGLDCHERLHLRGRVSGWTVVTWKERMRVGGRGSDDWIVEY